MVWIACILWIAQKLQDTEVFAGVGATGGILALLLYVVLYNRMMVYVEHRAYKKNTTEDSRHNTKY